MPCLGIQQLSRPRCPFVPAPAGVDVVMLCSRSLSRTIKRFHAASVSLGPYDFGDLAFGSPVF